MKIMLLVSGFNSRASSKLLLAETSTAIMKFCTAVCAMLRFDTITDKQHASLFKSSESVLLESLEFIRGTSLLWQREVSCREQRACLCSKEAFTRANIL
ncbi:hypothetical protein Chor_003838 [Crotalus horridus]